MKLNLSRLLAALFLALFAAACDSPTGGPGAKPEPAQEDARVGFSVNLSGLNTNTLVVHVTAPDITTPLVFNVPVVNGTATGNIAIPPGKSRTITVRAYDAQGILTHEGSAVVQQVHPGQNMLVVITLIPKAGQVPITIHIGSLVVSVSRVRPAPAGGDPVGDTVRFTAQVTFPDGRPVPGAVVRWASANPSIGSVDAGGLVTGHIPGSTEIVATYEGFGASHPVTFVLANLDLTAPTLVGVNATPDSVTMGSIPATVDVSFAVTADDAGRGFFSTSVVLQSPDGATTRQCSATGPSAPGRATRTCAITLPRTGPGGRWTVRELTIADSAGNSRGYTAAALAAAGFDSGVTMTGTTPDSEGPVLLGAGFGMDYVNASEVTIGVDVIVEAIDSGSGIQRVEVIVRHEQGGYGITLSTDNGTLRPVGGDYWAAYLPMDLSWPSGWVYMDTVRLTDGAGNEVILGSAESSHGWHDRFYMKTAESGIPGGAPIP